MSKILSLLNLDYYHKNLITPIIDSVTSLASTVTNILTDISNLKTSKADKTSLSTVATSGSYNDLSNRPSTTGVMTINCDDDMVNNPNTWNYNFDLLFGNVDDNIVLNPVYKSNTLKFNPVVKRLYINNSKVFTSSHINHGWNGYTITSLPAGNTHTLTSTNACTEGYEILTLTGWRFTDSSGNLLPNIGLMSYQVYQRKVRFIVKNFGSAAVTNLNVRVYYIAVKPSDVFPDGKLYNDAF